MALVCACLGVAGCHKPREVAEDHVPEVQIFDVQMTSFKGTRRVAYGHATSMAYERASADVMAEDSTVTLLKSAQATDSTEVPAARVQAPVMVGNLINHGVDGSGGVRMMTPTGTSAATDRAHFDSIRLFVSGTDPVHVEGPRYEINANGFGVNIRTDDFLFEGAVHGRLGGGG